MEIAMKKTVLNAFLFSAFYQLSLQTTDFWVPTRPKLHPKGGLMWPFTEDEKKSIQKG